MSKPREFWIKKGSYEGTHPKYENFYSSIRLEPTEDTIHVREVLPTDKTPEQVIDAVCDFLNSEYACAHKLVYMEDGDRSMYEGDIDTFIKANKDRILK